MTAMRLLLTRPSADSLATAQILQQHHIATLSEPLFDITARTVTLPDLANFQALIFTSRHAIRHFARLSSERNMPVYCVGDQSAETARETGFTTVFSADGNEDNLFDLITGLPFVKLLRLTGYPQDDLSTKLQEASYQVTSLQLYETVEHTTLSSAAIEALTEQKLDGVLFFSPKTVSRFYALMHKHDLTASCRFMTAWCISENTAKALGDLTFKQIKIAPKPTQKALLDLILKEHDMFTEEELPPVPKFKVSKWLFSGMMAWSLFFGAVGGLGILLLADFGPEKISPNRELKQNVAIVDSRVDALEQRTQKLNEQQKNLNAQAATPDSNLTKILIGLTQLKTAYDSDTSLSDGIATLKTTIKNNAIQQNLVELEKVTSDNFPSKETILADLEALQTPNNATLRNEQGTQPMDWRSRAKLAVTQLVRVTPTQNIIKDKQVERVEQAVANGDYTLAKKFAAALPSNPATQIITAQLAVRSSAENLVQKIISQIGSAMNGSAGSLY